MISYSIFLIIGIILVAVVFDFTNGMHDAANSIATVVSTRVLTPRQAVIWAAFFNFVAFAIFGTAVASTIGKGLIDIHIVTPYVILAGLLGAISWNLITWWLGLPTSSSHALIGGYAGAAIAKAGFKVIILHGWTKTIIFIFLAPMIGMVLGMIFITISLWVLHKRDAAPAPVNSWSKRLQLVSSAAYSLGHGSNDAQKTIGIVTSLLFSAGLISTFKIPFWVIVMAYTAIAAGTMSGGWRIVKTMGQKIIRLRPIDGVCAESASAISLFLATALGVPVSTTHVITGAISGVGTIKSPRKVKWNVVFKIVWAWLLTIPMAGSIGYILYIVTKLVFRA